MKKSNKTEKLTLNRDTLKNLAVPVRTGVKAGLISQQCHPHSGLSLCVICPQ